MYGSASSGGVSPQNSPSRTGQTGQTGQTANTSQQAKKVCCSCLSGCCSAIYNYFSRPSTQPASQNQEARYLLERSQSEVMGHASPSKAGAESQPASSSSSTSSGTSPGKVMGDASPSSSTSSGTREVNKMVYQDDTQEAQLDRPEVSDATKAFNKEINNLSNAVRRFNRTYNSSDSDSDSNRAKKNIEESIEEFLQQVTASRKFDKISRKAEAGYIVRIKNLRDVLHKAENF